MFAQENMVSGGVNSATLSDSSNPIQNTSSTTSDLTSGNNATTTSNITSDEQTSGNITSNKGLALLDALKGKSLGEKSLTRGPLKGLQEGGIVKAAPSGPNVMITDIGMGIIIASQQGQMRNSLLLNQREPYNEHFQKLMFKNILDLFFL